MANTSYLTPLGGYSDFCQCHLFVHALNYTTFFVVLQLFPDHAGGVCA